LGTERIRTPVPYAQRLNTTLTMTPSLSLRSRGFVLLYILLAQS
jgi:hypothetical protein